MPESRFARVMAVEADTVAHAGSTLTVTTPLRVGRLRDQTAELALNLPDTLPPGVYQIEVGSLATLGMMVIRLGVIRLGVIRLDRLLGSEAMNRWMTFSSG